MSGGTKFYREKENREDGQGIQGKGWLGKTLLKRWYLRQDLGVKGQASRYLRRESFRQGNCKFKETASSRNLHVLQTAANRPVCLSWARKVSSAEIRKKWEGTRSRRVLETIIRTLPVILRIMGNLRKVMNQQVKWSDLHFQRSTLHTTLKSDSQGYVQQPQTHISRCFWWTFVSHILHSARWETGRG